MRSIILGSSSLYRRELLARLRLDFATDSPDIDETPKREEKASDYVHRLAHEKATAVGARHPDALVIGCDQCADLNGKLLGKPGDHENAVRQMRNLSGQSVAFLTGLCLLDTGANTRQYFESRHTVHYRELDAHIIERYLQLEKPYNCTASFKSEGLGISLVHRISGDDPTALVGLPMIRLVEMLSNAGVEIPGEH